ncbi:alcohol acetyltransferase [Culicoidibacter larvae]|uniref:Alcohol acetyltransferase n=1 Tax=Culicoidibacter larvae TaxID=2579976 RepID=A0A5R8QDE0_9FIRM|nr:alcohol acetyltransferase [Culicoidibacter larvae]TLG75277.1 alcohol acetyltransferase [Culicoidibacter larvae]
MSKWYPLDNAAKLFSAVTKPSNTSVFRVAIIMKDSIQPETLQLALDQITDRFPTMNLQLHNGLFWKFLAENPNRILVEEESEYPCAPLHAKSNHNFYYRILYFNRRISIEVFHSLTDGNGAVEFLKTLVYQYLHLLGHDIEDEGLILLPKDIASSREKEDSYGKYYAAKAFKKQKHPQAFHLAGSPLDPPGNNVINGLIEVDTLRAVAKKYGVTITSYLSAVLIYTIYQECYYPKIDSGDVRITIPVNLRNIFPSKTLRNFFSVVTVGNPYQESLDFALLATEIDRQLKHETSSDSLLPVLAGNMRWERLMAIRLVPEFIKNWGMRYGFNAYGEETKTMSLSNLGAIRFPSQMQPFIDWMEVVLYPTQKSPINCGICSTGHLFTISFARTIEDAALISAFFRFLKEHDDITATVYGNEWGYEQ